MVRILGIGASPRKGGNTDILLDTMLRGAKYAGVHTETIYLRDYIYQPCIGCERCRKDKRCSGLQDGMQLIYPSIIETKGLILVSPTHNYNVTAWMKAFIDRLYCFYDYTKDRPRKWSSRLIGQGRTAVIACIGEQPTPEEGKGLTLEAMRLPLEALGYDVIGELSLLSMFDKGIVKGNTNALKDAEALGNRLAVSLLKKN